MNNQKFISKHSKDILLVIIVLCANIGSSLLIIGTASNITYSYDETVHIAVAKSISEGRGFFVDYSPWFGDVSINFFQNYPQISNPYNGKGPIYYLLSGGILSIIEPQPYDVFNILSFLNVFLTSSFLVTFFIFCKRSYGSKIAFFSALVIAIWSYTVWFSIRVNPYPLNALLIAISYLFFKKTKHDFFLFGIFSGLAHLTHPMSFIIPLSYTVFLLTKKEFKGAAIVLGTSSLLLIPWIIRNVMELGRIGDGLAIPFNVQISKTLGLEPYYSDPGSIDTTKFSSIDPLGQLTGIMTSNVILVLLSVGFCFLIFLAFKNKFVAENLEKSPDHKFILIFFIISILAALYAIPTFGWIPYLNYFTPLILLVIPFSINFIKKIIHNFGLSFKTKQITFLLVCIFITSMSVLDFTYSAESINYFLSSIPSAHDISTSKQFHKWIVENIPKDSIIASELPWVTFRETGLKTIGLDPTNLNHFVAIIDYYKPKYVILYDVLRFNSFLESFYPHYFVKRIFTTEYDRDNTLYYSYGKEYDKEFLIRTVEQPIIIKKYEIYEITTLDVEIEKKIQNIKDDNLSADVFLHKLLRNPAPNLDSIYEIEGLVDYYKKNGQLNSVSILYDKLIEKDGLNFDYWDNKIKLLKDLEEKKSYEKNMENFFYIQNKVRQTLLTSDLIDYSQTEINSQFNGILFESIQKNAYNDFWLKKLYDEILSVDGFNADALLGLAKMHEKNSDFATSVRYYELLLPLVDNKEEIQAKIDELKTRL